MRESDGKTPCFFGEIALVPSLGGEDVLLSYDITWKGSILKICIIQSQDQLLLVKDDWTPLQVVSLLSTGDLEDGFDEGTSSDRYIRACALSRNGELAIASRAKIYIYDLAKTTGKLPRWLYKTSIRTECHSLVWSHTLHRLVTVGSLIKVWDPVEEAGLSTWKSTLSKRYRGDSQVLGISQDDEWLVISHPRLTDSLILYSLDTLEEEQILRHHRPIEKVTWEHSGPLNILFVWPRNGTLWIWGQVEKHKSLICLAILDSRTFLPLSASTSIVPLPDTVLSKFQISSVDSFLLLGQGSACVVSLTGLGKDKGRIQLPLRSQTIGPVIACTDAAPIDSRRSIVRFSDTEIVIRRFKSGDRSVSISLDLGSVLASGKDAQVTLEAIEPASFASASLQSTLDGLTASLIHIDDTTLVAICAKTSAPFTDRPEALIIVNEEVIDLQWSPGATMLAVLMKNAVEIWSKGTWDTERRSAWSSILRCDFSHLASAIGCKSVQWAGEDQLDLLLDRYHIRLKKPMSGACSTNLRHHCDSLRRLPPFWHPSNLECLIHFLTPRRLEQYCRCLLAELELSGSGDFFSVFSADAAAEKRNGFEKSPLEHFVQNILVRIQNAPRTAILDRLAALISMLPAIARLPLNADKPGHHFLVFIKRLDFSPAVVSPMTLCAYHSKTQPLLISQVTEMHQGRINWQTASRIGLVRWIRDVKVLEEQVDLIARNELNKDDARDPILPSLFYLALGKKRLVQNLWRQMSWHTDASNITNFLKNDFETSRWRLAAKKNAFALLSRQRFHLAATFFLLADSPSDAINVCIRQLNDVDLALLIARLYRHETRRRDCYENVLVIVRDRAFLEDDRYTLSWALAELNHGSDALKSLHQSLSSLRALHAPHIISKQPLEPHDQSILATMYEIARDSPSNTGSPAILVDETPLVLFSIRSLMEHGSWLAAIALAKSFHYHRPSAKESKDVRGVQEQSQIRPNTEAEYQPVKTHLTLLGSTQRKVVDVQAVEAFSMDNFDF